MSFGSVYVTSRDAFNLFCAALRTRRGFHWSTDAPHCPPNHMSYTSSPSIHHPLSIHLGPPGPSQPHSNFQVSHTCHLTLDEPFSTSLVLRLSNLVQATVGSDVQTKNETTTGGSPSMGSFSYCSWSPEAVPEIFRSWSHSACYSQSTIRRTVVKPVTLLKKCRYSAGAQSTLLQAKAGNSILAGESRKANDFDSWIHLSNTGLCATTTASLLNDPWDFLDRAASSPQRSASIPRCSEDYELSPGLLLVFPLLPRSQSRV